MRSKEPAIPRFGDRVIRKVGDDIGVREKSLRCVVCSEQIGKLVFLPQPGQIDLVGKRGEDLGVPLGEFGGAVVPQCEALFVRG
jgi:hypothetical protein